MNKIYTLTLCILSIDIHANKVYIIITAREQRTAAEPVKSPVRFNT